MTIRKSLVFLLAILLYPLLAGGEVLLTDEIPLNRKTVYGTLPNGLHYIIHPNDVPADKIEFRLVLKTGSLLQNDDEGGAAHFIEHMAFNGTRNFPGNGIVEYLESLGIKYGFGINAFTGFDRTIYLFSIPKNDKPVFEKGLEIMGDWLSGIQFDPVEVENEKGIILEEARSFDTGDPFYHLKIGNGRQIRRLPLGTDEEIRNMTAERLKNFYEKWYTNDLATIILVGDLDVEEAEKALTRILGELPERRSDGFRKYPLEYGEAEHYTEIQDELNRRSSLDLIIPHPSTVQRTWGDLIRKEREQMLVRLIGDRLQFKGRKIWISDKWYLSDTDHLAFTIEGKDSDEILKEVRALATTLSEIRETGFCTGEMSGQKETAKAAFGGESGVKSSEQWCDDFIDLTISGERYLQSGEYTEWICRQIEETTSEELIAILDYWLTFLPEKLAGYRYHPSNSRGLTMQEIEEAWKEGYEAEYKPFVFFPVKAKPKKLETPPCLSDTIEAHPEYITEEKYYPGIGTEEILLSNGTRLVLKPTTDESRTIYVSAFAPGGLSRLSEEQYPLLEGVVGYMEMGGIEGVKCDHYYAYLAQEEMGLNLFIDHNWHGLMATAPADKSSELCRLIQRKCFCPEKKYKDFEEIRQEMLADLGKEDVLSKMLQNDPNRMLSARIDELMGNSTGYTATADTRERIEAMNLDSLAAFYRSVYTDPDGMTYVVTGNFDLEEVKGNLISVLGSFPTVEGKDRKDDTFDFSLPQHRIQEGIPGDCEEQTVFDYLLSGHHRPGLKETLKLKLVRDVIQNRLIRILREEQSLVYSPYVMLFYKAYPKPIYYFDINASAQTGNLKKIEQVIEKIIRDIRRNTISEEELLSLKRSFEVTKKETLNESASIAWRKYIQEALQNGEKLEELERYSEILASITPEDLREASRNWLDIDRCVLLYLDGKR